jgi:hypothetical protein
VAAFFVGNAWFGLPIGYQAPEQPIDFPHTVHAGEVEDGGIGLDCTFCHRNVAVGAAATVPAVEQCMFCHSQIKGEGSDSDTAATEIAILRAAAEADEPINWERVHRLPDHVQFVHDAHIRFFSEQDNIEPSAVCSTCHGEVQTMTVVEQVRVLKMGDCVDCHRENSAPTDCSVCHY